MLAGFSPGSNKPFFTFKFGSTYVFCANDTVENKTSIDIENKAFTSAPKKIAPSFLKGQIPI
jgi:hypothetical protein